jgi:hypothetical protein
MSVENCIKAEAKEGQIVQELNNAETAGHRLSSRIDDLNVQLASVLHDTEPSKEKDSKAEETLVPLAYRIRKHYLTLQDLGTLVGEMMDRLEIR